MNRIQQLADQAKTSIPHGTLGIEEWIKTYNQKFAELIVAECMEVFSKDLPEPGDGRMLEVVNRVCNVAEHFGVKE